MDKGAFAYIEPSLLIVYLNIKERTMLKIISEVFFKYVGCVTLLSQVSG